jgi:hypothetical protein
MSWMKRKNYGLSPGRADEILREKQRYLAAVRRGGYGRISRREQLRLDAINRQRTGRQE